MQWGDAREFLNGIFSRDEAAFSRRDMLAGLGLAALFATAPKLLAPGVAEAKPAPVRAPEAVDATNTEAAEPGADERNAADSDATAPNEAPIKQRDCGLSIIGNRDVRSTSKTARTVGV